MRERLMNIKHLRDAKLGFAACQRVHTIVNAHHHETTMVIYYDVTITTEWIGSGRKSDGWRIAVPFDDAEATKFGDLLKAVIDANRWASTHGWVYRMETASKTLRRRPPNAMTYEDFRGAVI